MSDFERTREIRPVDMQKIIKYLEENLRLDVKTESHYVGDTRGGESLYKDSHVIQLILNDKVISDVYL